MAKSKVVAVASGKGGTGKTTIAANLAWTASQQGRKVGYLDCDVEEPNGHIFLKPSIKASEDVAIEVPLVDQHRCTGCGKCGRICQYSAIVCLGRGNVLTFDELCHSCGGCLNVCPAGAIKARDYVIGRVDTGKAGSADFVQGYLKVGNVRTPHLIKKVKKNIGNDGLWIVDVPPGTSCAVVESLRNVDFCLLVTEPTAFGLNDLEMAVELIEQMNIDYAVVINRDGIGDDAVEQYCRDHGIEIAARFPDDRSVAEAYSRGEMVAREFGFMAQRYAELLNYVESRQSEVV